MIDQGVIPFRRRRTYLDACRESGVWQSREELLAEKAESEAHLAKLNKAHTAPVLSLAAIHARSHEFAVALDHQRTEFHRRVSIFIDAYASQVGSPCADFLRHVIIHDEIRAEDAEKLFKLIAEILKGSDENER